MSSISSESDYAIPPDACSLDSDHSEPEQKVQRTSSYSCESVGPVSDALSGLGGSDRRRESFCLVSAGGFGEVWLPAEDGQPGEGLEAPLVHPQERRDPLLQVSGEERALKEAGC